MVLRFPVKEPCGLHPGILPGWGGITIGVGLEVGLPVGFIGALQGWRWYQDFRGMLKGTQAGTRISLSVRQKYPLPGRSTGGIGDLKVSTVVVLGNRVEKCGGVFFLRSFPNFRCTRMIGAAELENPKVW